LALTMRTILWLELPARSGRPHYSSRPRISSPRWRTSSEKLVAEHRNEVHAQLVRRDLLLAGDYLDGRGRHALGAVLTAAWGIQAGPVRAVTARTDTKQITATALTPMRQMNLTTEKWIAVVKQIELVAHGATRARGRRCATSIEMPSLLAWPCHA